MPLLAWRRAEDGRALWWRGQRVQLVRIGDGARWVSPIFDSEAAALVALQADRAIVWTAVAAPRYYEDRRA